MISDAFPLDPPTDWFTTLPDWFEPSDSIGTWTVARFFVSHP